MLDLFRPMLEPTPCLIIKIYFPRSTIPMKKPNSRAFANRLRWKPCQSRQTKLEKGEMEFDS